MVRKVNKAHLVSKEDLEAKVALANKVHLANRVVLDLKANRVHLASKVALVNKVHLANKVSLANKAVLAHKADKAALALRVALAHKESKVWLVSFHQFANKWHLPMALLDQTFVHPRIRSLWSLMPKCAMRALFAKKHVSHLDFSCRSRLWILLERC